jgi:L-lactate utilization protein LutB
MTAETIDRTIAALESNGFRVHRAADRMEAAERFWREVFDSKKHRCISYADSETMLATGVLETLRSRGDVSLIETFGQTIERATVLENRRRAFLSDLFLTGSNALTEKGQLVNLDMVGNRVGAIAFGPKELVLFIGANKIVPDLEAAFDRVKNVAAVKNAIRHPAFETPCQVTGTCSDCSSPDRICNVWTITEKSFPRGRIHVILIDEQLGL